MIRCGDVFVTTLERGLYGAFRILKIGKILDFDTDSYLIGITDYCDLKKPELCDARLIEILHENRFFCRNKPCISIYSDLSGIIEKHFEYLGNIPLTKDEMKLQLIVGSAHGGFTLDGPVLKNLGYNAFLEWRWKNDRDEMIKENEMREKKSHDFKKNGKLESNAMMSDVRFWEIIGMFDWMKHDEDDIILPSIKFLSKLKVVDIMQFEENLTFKLFCIDTKEHALNIGAGSYNEKDNHFSVDLFLYARCSAIAKGRDFYQNVLKDPTKMPKDETFEVLLYLSSRAYKMKTKKEFEVKADCDYETYSNIEGWK